VYNVYNKDGIKCSGILRATSTMQIHIVYECVCDEECYLMILTDK